MTQELAPSKHRVEVRKDTSTRGSRDARWAVMFLTPALLFVGLLFLFPIAYNLYVSFFNWSAVREPSFTGLGNYASVLTSGRFWNALANTLYFTAITVPAGVILSFLVALGFYYLKLKRGANLIRALYFAPVVASLVAVAFVWLWIFNPSYGLANDLMTSLGLPGRSWLNSTGEVIPSLGIMYVWARLGFNMIIFIAGLNAIDPSYFEAAKLDGARRWQTLRYVILPLLNRQIVLVVSVETMNALKLFELPFAATDGGPTGASRSLVMEIYDQAFRFDRWGISSVYVLVMLALVIVVTGVLRKILSRDAGEA